MLYRSCIRVIRIPCSLLKGSGASFAKAVPGSERASTGMFLLHVQSMPNPKP